MQANGFSFGFYDEPNNLNGQDVGADSLPSVAIESDSLGHMLKYIPEKLSYARVSGLGHTFVQRELWDVKMQLMEQDDSIESDDKLKVLDGCNDLVPNVYEGGYKTWECSLDLANEIKKIDVVKNNLTTVLELGCGSAIPILSCFQEFYKHRIPCTLVFQDFNVDVLRYVTLPNLLLNWYFCTQEHDSSEKHGTIDVSPSLLQEFSDDLARTNIYCEFLCGCWSEEMQLLIQRTYGDHYFSLVLASETIYSLPSLENFLYMLLKNTKNLALVAGKDLYFGVGGSILEFNSRLQKLVDDPNSLKAIKTSTQNVGRSIVYWEKEFPPSNIDSSPQSPLPGSL
ncbi:S-adenosylmethionine-dependent methyltransferase [Schizosaccharomyces pombe]|uniref:Histidine protein methyltransferase 1 n=1 Tax=Schizosaccharomyces pombe (strain 972 / ATCC 24843) TaxID=284812 RepID=HPM1_SCHPO|nr:putative S-adenosylmethionine-dependent methyltransferase [Schizosaccharomyces pombe]Q9UTQ8.1 RecName: Full=Histidine protein methyltransferase 1; AltName: Full=Methyltransferase-like protein 18 homolog C1071.05 [Schizosaccharomyces pombe 972h-]CAB59881.1 S-adenosylmethionine-dependent methyltransferase (predicted) [Schizosaccharomyces pombe]|eukprot:NP_594355.1 putative S-adenosylmethionine-dependent methyltransferase [Schizosaccharomyces pombe]